MADFRPLTTRLMALDVGSKTIGVALSDPLRITVRPYATLGRRSLHEDCSTILRLARDHEVGRLVVGRPSHLDGRPSDVLDMIEPLVQRLRACSSLPVEWMDERLSTREAEALMAEAGIPPTQRRRKRNEYAAAVILRWYLEERR